MLTKTFTETVRSPEESVLTWLWANSRKMEKTKKILKSKKSHKDIVLALKKLLEDRPPTPNIN